MDFEKYTLQELQEIKSVQKEIRDDLRQHMRRTDLNESMILKLEESLQNITDRIESLYLHLKPIQLHVQGVTYAWKILLAIGSLAGIIYTIMRILGKV
jgi:hypothetical protein